MRMYKFTYLLTYFAYLERDERFRVYLSQTKTEHIGTNRKIAIYETTSSSA